MIRLRVDELRERSRVGEEKAKKVLAARVERDVANTLEAICEAADGGKWSVTFRVLPDASEALANALTEVGVTFTRKGGLETDVVFFTVSW